MSETPRVLSLFIASSLDGYIARPDGKIDWLFTDEDYGYRSFFQSVDTLLMGRKTFEQAMSFGEYPYPGKRVIVFSHSLKNAGRHDVEIVSTDPVQLAQFLKAEKYGKKIWLVGGSKLIQPLLEADQIDEIVLSIHPILLGGGIPLFSKLKQSLLWKTRKTESFASGLVQITFTRERP